jgi:RNase P/RNase MRP subunit p30
MYDIFAASLEHTPRARTRVRVDVTYLTKPGTAPGVSIARSTDQRFLKSGITMLTDLELLDSRRDNLHHRNSGLDSTSAKLCAKHEVLVGINLANLRTLDPVILGRVMQNIALCRSHGARMTVYTNAQREEELATPEDIMALLRTLGMSTQQAKQTLGNLERAVRNLADKASGVLVRPGVRKA